MPPTSVSCSADVFLTITSVNVIGVFTDAVLFVVFGSGGVVDRVGVSVIVCTAGGRTSRVAVAPAPGSKVERSQSMKRFPEQLPRVVLIETMPVPDSTVLL